ncbi:MAG: recombinase RecA [Dehalococcoidales bacterium]|nr:recombinase RecA [Dehalococcoidales bacterium]
MVKSSTGNNGSGDGKLKALEDAISHIEKRFGKGSILRMGESGGRMAVEVIPSGSLSLDLALGVGGIPRGRVTEIYGPESSGKTTLAYHVVAEAQKKGGTALYIDVEHALDPGYAAGCGVNVEDLLISQPDWGEQALDIVEAVVRSGAVDVVVIDSVAALVPKAEVEGNMGDSHMALQARLMSQALRKLCSVIADNHTAVIFINQLREKVGIRFGNPETTSGGRALKFYASVRIDLRMKDSVNEGNCRIGNVVSAKVVKNKVAAPFRQARFDIMFGQGISREGEILDLGEGLGILSKKGAWYHWDGQPLGQGREAARRFLKEHQDVARQIESLIRSKAAAPAFRMEETAEYHVQKPDDQLEARNNNQDNAEAETTAAVLLDTEEWQNQN